jgi:hypothetical protein
MMNFGFDTHGTSEASTKYHFSVLQIISRIICITFALHAFVYRVLVVATSNRSLVE